MLVAINRTARERYLWLKGTSVLVIEGRYYLRMFFEYGDDFTKVHLLGAGSVCRMWQTFSLWERNKTLSGEFHNPLSLALRVIEEHKDLVKGRVILEPSDERRHRVYTHWLRKHGFKFEDKPYSILVMA